MDNTQAIIFLAQKKSMGVALILSFLFGPLGLLYSSVVGGVVMIVVSLLVALVTLGFGLIITWPICMIWAAVATNSHNKKLMDAGRAMST